MRGDEVGNAVVIAVLIEGYLRYLPLYWLVGSEMHMASPQVYKTHKSYLSTLAKSDITIHDVKIQNSSKRNFFPLSNYV